MHTNSPQYNESLIQRIEIDLQMLGSDDSTPSSGECTPRGRGTYDVGRKGLLC
eukprot:CAMPEP_0181289886 /NCGR_PEP_ID=MMETSP1101-20121128/1122_1 /TAXON_ID=46948 /ORGANISM="Rhodomonas abbreviata, Strain Caron Lab Isolate" /LENGTH=52 /DNA_ID=CAMNT_0023394139 /DNA_START=567 /DNA_END=725 /DNA_ORIENTATION=+